MATSPYRRPRIVAMSVSELGMQSDGADGDRTTVAVVAGVVDGLEIAAEVGVSGHGQVIVSFEDGFNARMGQPHGSAFGLTRDCQNGHRTFRRTCNAAGGPPKSRYPSPDGNIIQFQEDVSGFEKARVNPDSLPWGQPAITDEDAEAPSIQEPLAGAGRAVDVAGHREKVSSGRPHRAPPIETPVDTVLSMSVNS